MPLNVIDISSHQGDIDLSAIGGLDGVIVKATEGTDYVNPYCDSKVQQAFDNGLCVGVYHFASGTDPIAEANFFVDNCTGYIGRVLFVLDWEAEAISCGVEWARMFMQRVYEKTGCKPLIYMSQSVTNEYDWSSVANENGLWCASYPNVNRPGFDYDGDMGDVIGAWETMAMWQYCSDGSVSGYDGNLDLNHFYGSVDTWNMYINSGTQNDTQPEPEPSPSKEQTFDNIESVTIKYK